ncbi:MAG TPA: hypothetical protein DD473_06150 [Planctomycetaceae bacterium]|nr:hypothetical protein [Planctomycetaceae bacterium]
MRSSYLCGKATRGFGLRLEFPAGSLRLRRPERIFRGHPYIAFQYHALRHVQLQTCKCLWGLFECIVQFRQSMPDRQSELRIFLQSLQTSRGRVTQRTLRNSLGAPVYQVLSSFYLCPSVCIRGSSSFSSPGTLPPKQVR